MRKTWIVIDVENLAWRAQHTTGGMVHDGRPTGVVYGLLRELIALHDRFVSHHFVFCFDSRTSLREQLFPGYKSSRRAKGTGDSDHARLHRKNRREVEAQVNDLLVSTLPGLGFRNLFCEDGYEADDLIAAACHTTDADQFVIVSSDHDLYQLLWQDHVSVFSPQTRGLMTEEKFVTAHKIHPSDWAWVKAVAGCETDDVLGVPGIGPWRACQHLRGELNEKSALGRKLRDFLLTEQFRTNLRLTRVPFDDKLTVRLRLRPQPMVEEGAWEEVCRHHGIKNLPYINFAK